MVRSNCDRRNSALDNFLGIAPPSTLAAMVLSLKLRDLLLLAA
jgi:hypothetical protein